MSFINHPITGKGWEAGYFLVDNEDCTRVTKEISTSHAQVVTREDGSKYVPAGAIYPSNDGNAVGIVYEPVDVTTGNMPGSVVTRGAVYGDRLPAAAEDAAKSAMTGIQFVASSPAINRPTSFNKKELAAITVTSTEGTGSGKTDVAVSGYTLGAGERYAYKIAQGTAPAAVLGQILPLSGTGAWTVATFPLDELSATDGHKITVAAIDTSNAVVAAGNATLDVKA